jgi:tetratricopeptide (TPR) repeat protein
VSRFAVHRLAELGSDGSNVVEVDERRGEEIVAAVRAAGRLDLTELAVDLASAAWAVLAPTPDRRWWRRLAAAGEDAAIDGRSPDGLAEVLHRSCCAFARANDATAADDQWRRAFVVTERLGDHERSAELLRLVAELRSARGALGRAMTVYFEIVALHTTRADHLGAAEALADLAVTMARAGRHDDASHLRRRAASNLPAAGVLPTPAAPRYAAVLSVLGRAWDDADEPASAMRCYSKALEVLVDVDENAADEIRGLLAAAARARATQDPRSASRGTGGAARPSAG